MTHGAAVLGCPHLLEGGHETVVWLDGGHETTVWLDGGHWRQDNSRRGQGNDSHSIEGAGSGMTGHWMVAARWRVQYYGDTPKVVTARVNESVRVVLVWPCGTGHERLKGRVMAEAEWLTRHRMTAWEACLGIMKTGPTCHMS
jgi:hypothetical protein